MNDKEKEILALAEMIDDTFTSEYIIGMLISTLLHIYDDDVTKIIIYIAQMKQVASETNNLH